MIINFVLSFDIFQPLFYGFLSGILLSFGFGTVFFALVQSSIENGYKAGIKISFGVVFSDALMIAFALFGTTFLSNSEEYKYYIRIGGGILLIALGISQFMNQKAPTKIQDFKIARFFYFFGKGFLLNVINPVNFFSWVVLSASLKSQNYQIIEETIFFSASILAIFISESIMAIYAYKIGSKFSDSVILKIKYFTGISFILTALKLIYDALIG